MGLSWTISCAAHNGKGVIFINTSGNIKYRPTTANIAAHFIFNGTHYCEASFYYLFMAEMVLLCVSAPVTAFSNHDLTHRLITCGGVFFFGTVNKPTPWPAGNEVTKPDDAIYRQKSAQTLKRFRNYFNLFKQTAARKGASALFWKTTQWSFNGLNVSGLVGWTTRGNSACCVPFWYNAGKKCSIGSDICFSVRWCGN